MTDGTLSKAKIVFLGAGNMAEALVKGMLQARICSAGNLWVTDVLVDRTNYFHAAYGVSGSNDSRTVVHDANLVVLSVKPQVIGDVLEEVKDVLNKDAAVISIAAGTSTARIEDALGDSPRVVRVMPNTPALVGQGAAAVCGGRWATPDDLRVAEAMMSAVGLAVRVDEKDMDAVTALSGSGPAYVFYLVEAMLAAAATLGLEESMAKDLVYKTVMGAAELLIESDDGPAVLRQRVTSKGGTTAAALAVLNQGRVADAVVEAIEAAWARSRELSGD